MRPLTKEALEMVRQGLLKSEWCGFSKRDTVNQLFDLALKGLFAPTEARENEWLEDELMEVMRIVAKGMNPDLPEEDEIIYAMMVTAIRRLMEADTDRYEALLERWQKRHASVSPPLPHQEKP